ncbi:MAG: hypothetical protein ACTSU2_15775 [Promethearchaeota archaeon]
MSEKVNQKGEKEEFINEKLEDIIQNIFPQINIDTDQLMEELNSKYKKGKLNEEGFLRELSMGLVNIFSSHDEDFRKFGFGALEFMKKMQRYSKEVIDFLEDLTKKQLENDFKNTGNETNSAELIKIFFRILGRAPR